MTYNDIKELRKSGKPEEAARLGENLLRTTEGAFHVNHIVFQLLFAYHDIVIASIKKSNLNIALPIKRYEELLRQYARTEPKRPDKFYSIVLGTTEKLGRYLQKYDHVIRWGGDAGQFRAEDFIEDRWGEGKLDRRDPLAARIGRELVAWSGREGHTRKDQEFALAFAERVLQRIENSGDSLWLRRDRARLLIALDMAGEAVPILKGILASKRRDAWAWADIAEALEGADPDISFAAWCRAIDLGRDEKMIVTYHLTLAKTLKGRGEPEWAAAEIAQCISTYEAEGWEKGAAAARRFMEQELAHIEPLPLAEMKRRRSEAARLADAIIPIEGRPVAPDGLQDETLSCKDCSKEFLFSAGEQRYFATKGFTKPVRCKSCRDIKKAVRAN